MLEKSTFTIYTRIDYLSIEDLRDLFEWLDARFGEDNWHFRPSKKVSRVRAVFFRNEKQKTIFDLTWSEIIHHERG